MVNPAGVLWYADAMRIVIIIALFLASDLAVAADWVVSAELWSRPRSGQELMSMEPVHQAVADWRAAPGSRMIINYPGGESGILWAEELRDWLVALGLPSADIDLQAGGTRIDQVLLHVEQQKEY